MIEFTAIVFIGLLCLMLALRLRFVDDEDDEKIKKENMEIEMNKFVDYNNLFDKLQKDCNVKNCCNIFANISLDELIELNYLLDRLLIFCENIDTDELEDYECGDKVLKLYKLADTLFSRDLS